MRIVCNDCEKLKECIEFNKNRTNKSGYQDICRNCQSARSKDYVKRNPGKHRSGYYLRKYKLTSRQVIELLNNQNNECKICNKILPSELNGLVKKQHQYDVDHCHKTNKVRGILCHNCNVGLGRFKDDSELLVKAAEYIKCHQ